MPKEFIKKYLPNPDSIRNNKSLSFLGNFIHDPNLWHLNRFSVTKAFAIGFFWGCIPMPFQMVPAAILAVRFKANLPLSVSLVWFTNPLTMPPIFYFEYLLGAWILQLPPKPFEFELSLQWLSAQLYDIAIPMYLGALLCGIVLSIAGYFAMDLLWRRHAIRRWRQRQLSRASKSK